MFCYSLQITKLNREILEDVDYTQKVGQSIVKCARQYLGTRYQFGSLSRAYGLDCSGLIANVFAQHGFRLPHTSCIMSRIGIYVSPRAVRPGDLLFFRGRSSPRVNHVALVSEITATGTIQFIHSSAGRGGVCEENLNIPKYRSIFVGARRILL